MKLRRLFSACLVLIVICALLSGCGAESSTAAPAEMAGGADGPEYTDTASLVGKKVAVPIGSAYELIIPKCIPGCIEMNYGTMSDCFMSVSTGKTEATVVLASMYDEVIAQYDNITRQEQTIDPVGMCFGLAKSDFGVRLQGELNEFLKARWDSGEQDSFVKDWRENPQDHAPVDCSKLEGGKRTLHCAIEPLDAPYTHMTANGFVGMEAEMLYEFCSENGYGLDISVVEWPSILPGIATGKYDIAMCVAYTEERAESILFTEPYENVDNYVICRKTSGGAAAVPEYEDTASLIGKKVAVCIGSTDEKVAPEAIPGCIMDGYTTMTDVFMAVSTGKAEATLAISSIYPKVEKEYPNLTRQSEPAASESIHFGMAKNDFGAQLQAELGEFLNARWESGEQEKFLQSWYEDPDSQPVRDFSDLHGTKGTIRCAIEPADSPYTRQTADGFTGIEAELLHEFCLKNGYQLEMSVMDFPAILPALSAGKLDMALLVCYTEERAESILFSEPYEKAEIYVVCRKVGSPAGEKDSLLTSVKESFEKNFIRESRWKLMARGLWVTIQVSVLSAIFGTLLGAVLCWLRRSGIRPVSTVTAGFIRIVQGVPIVVMLLVLYYVIFVNAPLSGLAVGVIGFSIDFSVYVAEILRSGIESIDRGQWEAAASLGFGQALSLTRVILPQALTRALPVYKGQFISMVKMTSVIGYLAVQDLAKAADIIRSRTYDAFFPLIATAVIYFLIAWLLTLLLGLVEIRIDPHSRKDPLADINTDAPISDTEVGQVQNRERDVVIELRGLRKEYETATPLENVSVEIRRGDVISVIGPSGTGKSTLLRCINRLETPTSGEIFAFGKTVPAKGKALNEMRMRMGMVFQSFNLFNHLTVIENIMLAPVLLKGVSRQQAYENGIVLLRKVGLAEKALCYPSELSGGQKQRIAIVRTLAMEPEIILFDEPTSALDPTMIGEVLHVISNLADSGMTMLIVTHEMKFARDVSNRVFYMDCGGIYEDGSSEQIFNRPEKERTRAFILRLKLFSFTIESRDFDFVRLRAELESFGHAQLMPRRLLDSMILCAEEIVMQGLRNIPGVSYPCELAAEYSENGELKLLLHYGGENADPMDFMDEVSLLIVRARSESLTHSYSPEAGNELQVTVK